MSRLRCYVNINNQKKIKNWICTNVIANFVLKMFAKEHFHDAQILAELITIKYKIRKCF